MQRFWLVAFTMPAIPFLHNCNLPMVKHSNDINFILVLTSSLTFECTIISCKRFQWGSSWTISSSFILLMKGLHCNMFHMHFTCDQIQDLVQTCKCINETKITNDSSGLRKGPITQGFYYTLLFKVIGPAMRRRQCLTHFNIVINVHQNTLGWVRDGVVVRRDRSKCITTSPCIILFFFLFSSSFEMYLVNHSKSAFIYANWTMIQM